MATSCSLLSLLAPIAIVVAALILHLHPLILISSAVALEQYPVSFEGSQQLVIGSRQQEAATRRFQFHVKYTTVTRLCHRKRIVTVNDEFPGPTLYVREGDRVLVKVTNELPNKNITIHWHGVRQLRTAWFDGPAYITQCPIGAGHTYLYNFTVTGQRGTLLWHAHITWMRATVHGAFIVLPKLPSPTGPPYPFPTPAKEFPLVLGEWWKSSTEAVLQQALQTGAGPTVSDAYTLNGQPGAFYKCSKQDIFKVSVKPNETYMLRIVNAGLNQELFFSIAHHSMTVVEIDATYTKPLPTRTVRIAPGQTTNVLITTNQPINRYYMAARAYDSANPTIPFDNTTTTAILEYEGSSSTIGTHPMKPTLPAYNDTTLANNFTKSLRSLNSIQYPANVPPTVDRHLFFTVGLGRKPCTHAAGHRRSCQGPSGGKFAAAVSNISFILPKAALLQTYFLQKKAGVFATTSFPDTPLRTFNYTGPQPTNLSPPQTGTTLSSISFNSTVQLVLQGTSILGTESHPIHLHGFNFFIVGEGNGNYNKSLHPQGFNLIDPPERNTVNVPKGGWVALRFRADNPGVWFMHCHLEIHTTWGLDTAFLVHNGIGPQQTLEPAPTDLPTC